MVAVPVFCRQPPNFRVRAQVRAGKWWLAMQQLPVAGLAATARNCQNTYRFFVRVNEDFVMWEFTFCAPGGRGHMPTPEIGDLLARRLQATDLSCQRC